MSLQITSEVRGVDATRREIERAQSTVGLATAKTLTRTASRIRKSTRGSMRSVFDRPTRYALNSMAISPATPRKLESKVFFKNESIKGNPATGFIEPQVAGGSRVLKGFERLLQRQGILLPGMFVVPGEDAPLDRFGNLKAGEITRVLSQMQSLRDPLQNKPTGRKSRGGRPGRGYRYFVAREKDGGRPIGIFRARGKKRAAQSIMIFVSSVRYQPRLPFSRISRKVYDRHFEPALEEQIQFEMKRSASRR